MGIVVFAAPVAGIRGKVGGIVYSANKSGPYLKSWGKGSNPRTAAQTNHRQNLVQFSQAWQNLTTGERTDWDTYAALTAQDKINSLGETYSASGFNWFCEINLNLRAAGAVQLDTAPTGPTPGTPILNDFVSRETGAEFSTRFNLDGASPDLTFIHATKAAVFSSEGHTAQAEIRVFMTAQLATGSTFFQIQNEMEEHFGTIQVGQNVFATIQAQSAEGRRGAVLSASAVALP